MAQPNDSSTSPSRSWGRTAIAALVLVLAVWVLLKIAIGIIAALFVPIVVVLGVLAIVWAYRVLF
jgi:uncharacterized membrane protein